MPASTIQIFFTILNGLVVLVGVPWLINLLVGIGRKLQILDHLEKTVNEEIKPDLKNIRERFGSLETRVSGLEDRVTGLWEKATGTLKTASPITLNEKGEKFLHESGLAGYIVENKDKLLVACDHLHEQSSAYDVQMSAFTLFDTHVFDEPFELKLKDYAYSQGIGLDVLRRVGGIYLRDLCLAQMKLSFPDLDPSPNLNLETG